MFRIRPAGPAGLVLILVLAAGPIGCGNPPTVRGTVTLDGKPVHSGTISFETPDGTGPSVGTAIEGGQFELTPAVPLTPGKKVVLIRTVMKTGRQVQVGSPAPPGMMTEETVTYPPPTAPAERHEADLKAGPNELSFELTTKPVKK